MSFVLTIKPLSSILNILYKQLHKLARKKNTFVRFIACFFTFFCKQPNHSLPIMNYLKLLLTIFLFHTMLFAQGQNTDEDAFFIRKIYDIALTEGRCYDWLHHLTTKVGGRLAGSPQAAAAVEYTRQMLDTIGLDSVWLQPCMVPHWERGDAETVRVVNSSTMGSVD